MSELGHFIEKTKNQTEVGWSEPEIYNLELLEDQLKLESAFRGGKIARVFDHIDEIARDLFEHNHPELRSDVKGQTEYVNSAMFRGYEYGSWVLFPWSADLVRFPNEKDYKELRTARFRELITENEQLELSLGRIAIFGMSVGSNLAVSLARNGVGGAFLLGDYDSPSVSNIGRAELDMRDLGAKKIDATAKRISYINPFAEQVHMTSGFDEDSPRAVESFSPDIVGDEVDDMQISAQIRRLCAEMKVPYVTVSDVHDSVVMEICRHDLGSSPLFAGAVSDTKAEKLASGHLSKKEQESVFVKSIGYRHMTPRLINSSLEVGATLSGIPQLGSTALAAAGFATAAYRDILLGRDIKTGVYSLKIGAKLGQKPCAKEIIQTIKRYAKYMKNRV